MPGVTLPQGPAEVASGLLGSLTWVTWLSENQHPGLHGPTTKARDSEALSSQPCSFMSHTARCRQCRPKTHSWAGAGGENRPGGNRPQPNATLTGTKSPGGHSIHPALHQPQAHQQHLSEAKDRVIPAQVTCA